MAAEAAVLCGGGGGGNTAAYGPCVASAYAGLEVRGLPAGGGFAHPGLVMDLEVWKLDAYRQLIVTDSVSVLQVRARPRELGCGLRLEWEAVS